MTDTTEIDSQIEELQKKKRAIELEERKKSNLHGWQTLLDEYHRLKKQPAQIDRDSWHQQRLYLQWREEQDVKIAQTLNALLKLNPNYIPR